jgi:predicted ArsR family transcriptional regulator
VTRWGQRFFETTRGQIVVLLRRARRTVDDLAGALELTDNAVRAHLTSLERDGLVQQHGLRRGERRPSLVYELTSQAEQLFPKAHEPVLSRLVAVLHERLAPRDLDAALQEVGRRIASEYPRPTGAPAARLERAANVLSALGGLAEVETLPDGRMALRGFSCPIVGSPLVQDDLCTVAESLVAELSGLAVEQECARLPSEPPRCLFVVARQTGRARRGAAT